MYGRGKGPWFADGVEKGSYKNYCGICGEDGEIVNGSGLIIQMWQKKQPSRPFVDG